MVSLHGWGLDGSTDRMGSSMTPEESLEAKKAEIIAAGGVVGQVVPMAEPATPHTVAGYKIQILNPRPRSLDLSTLVQTDFGDWVEWTGEVTDASTSDGSEA